MINDKYFLRSFIHFFEDNYEDKISMIENFAQKENTSAAIIMFRFLQYAYQEFLDGKNAFDKGNALWN